MEKLLTIAIPCREEGREPKGTLESLFSSCPPELVDILVIDDGSKKAPPQVEDAEHVSVIRHKEPLGVGASVDELLNHAKTPFGMYMDSHMRFKKNNWAEAITEFLTKNKQAIAVSPCLGLDAGRQNPRRPRGAYFGTRLSFMPLESAKDKFWGMLEPRWSTKKEAEEQDWQIPCPMGGTAAFNMDWYRKLGGCRGIRGWGSEGVLLGLKSWMAGGSCQLLPDAGIGHIFRDKAPYSIDPVLSYFNKMKICQTVLPSLQGQIVMALLPPSKAKDQALRLLAQDMMSVLKDRMYFDSVFDADFEGFCKRFNIEVPAL